jgi:hypothetical protein
LPRSGARLRRFLILRRFSSADSAQTGSDIGADFFDKPPFVAAGGAFTLAEYGDRESLRIFSMRRYQRLGLSLRISRIKKQLSCGLGRPWPARQQRVFRTGGQPLPRCVRDRLTAAARPPTISERAQVPIGRDARGRSVVAATVSSREAPSPRLVSYIRSETNSSLVETARTAVVQTGIAITERNSPHREPNATGTARISSNAPTYY